MKSLKAQKGDCISIQRSDIGNYAIRRDRSHCFSGNLVRASWALFTKSAVHNNGNLHGKQTELFSNNGLIDSLVMCRCCFKCMNAWELWRRLRWPVPRYRPGICLRQLGNSTRLDGGTTEIPTEYKPTDKRNCIYGYTTSYQLLFKIILAFWSRLFTVN